MPAGCVGQWRGNATLRKESIVPTRMLLTDERSSNWPASTWSAMVTVRIGDQNCEKRGLAGRQGSECRGSGSVEGLKVPQKQRPRGRLWFNDGSCVRLQPERANHVWSYDFVKAMTNDGRTLRLLVLIDEYTRECLGDPRGQTVGEPGGDRDAGGV